jgi:catechol 2,3-dioxygenase-like lactoylglutathione lyase family enzyme
VSAAPTVWYRVRDLESGRAFYVGRLGLEEVSRDEEERWVALRRGQTLVGLTEGEPETDGAVAVVDVADVKAEAERLRTAGVDVGVVLELHDEIRIVDVFDPDGNRIQLAEDLPR